MDRVQPWGSPGALGQPPLRIRSKRAQRVFCSIAPSRRAEGGWWECQGGMGGRVRQVGESKGGDGRSERLLWHRRDARMLESKYGTAFKNPNRTLPPGKRWPKAEGSAPRIAAGYQRKERSAPGVVSTADSGGGGGGPRRMTLHLAGKVLSPRSLRSRGPSAPRTAPPGSAVAAGAPRTPSPPPFL